MTPEEFLAQLQQYDFEYFIDKSLENVPDTVDSREGSIIYDALAPAATDFAEIALMLQTAVQNSFTQTASGEFLDYRAQEKSTSRRLATKAQVKATFTDNEGNPVAVEPGDQFASMGADPFFYDVSKVLDVGSAILTAEIAGSGPNHYLGQILPVTPNDQLTLAQIDSIDVPARDDETDDSLRSRILSKDNVIAYGGNVADYERMIASLESVSSVQVFPTWQGAGTVKLAILDNSFDPASSTLVSETKEAIDPTEHTGDGYGLAPIGHKVTVVAPTKRTIPIGLHLETELGVTVNDVMLLLKAKLEEYFLGLRKAWGQRAEDGVGYKTYVYRSRVITTAMSLPGVTNATDATLEGVDADIELTATANKTELPYLGEVTYLAN